ncbi:MAG: AAA family ATPase, partial [Actinomycetota bacterium]
MNRPAAPFSCTRLFERDRELEAIADALDRLEQGTGSFFVIEGPAGIGKSRLVAAAGKLARGRGVEVLSARGTELESAFSFGVVRQLFEPALARLYPPERAELFEGSAAPAGRLLFPSGSAQERIDPGDAGALSLAHSLWWLTANLARRSPLLLSLDDAHWTDATSLKFFGYLLHRVEGVPVVVVVSVRTGEPASGVLNDLRGEPAALLSLQALTEDGTRDMAVSRLDRPADPAFVDSLHRTTRGNPLLLNETLRTVAEQKIPADAEGALKIASLELPSVSRTVLARVRRLGPEAVALAQAVAVWGGRAELHQAAAVAGIDRASAGRAADLLAAVEILQRGRPLEFAHPLVHKAVYADIAPAFKAEGHALAAGILKEAAAPVERS